MASSSTILTWGTWELRALRTQDTRPYTEPCDPAKQSIVPIKVELFLFLFPFLGVRLVLSGPGVNSWTWTGGERNKK